MRIIVESGSDLWEGEYSNMGDVSMLQTAVSRLQKLWPSATIEVITDSPDNLSKYCPGAKALSGSGKDIWLGDNLLLGRFDQLVPRSAIRFLVRLKRVVGLRWAGLLRTTLRARLLLQNRTEEIRAFCEFADALGKTDLIIMSGAGGFFDGCRRWNMQKLDTLEAAARRHIPVAMISQNIGPLNDPDVLARAKKAFPKVDLITLRGSRGGKSLVESLGVPIARVRTTGDEAIELAYSKRPAEIGNALGINLRALDSAEVNSKAIGTIKPILQQFARREHIAIVPLPIACHKYAQDHETIKKLLEGFDDNTDGGVTLDTPVKVIVEAGRCKVVITGAYHAAVFALSQGIPVVCLAISPYYASKFLGLQDLFGPGCEVLELSDEHLSPKFSLALERAWQTAAVVRPYLLAAAVNQIKLSKDTYNKLNSLIAPFASLEVPNTL